MTEKLLIELSEDDLKKVLCQHFGINSKTASIKIHKVEKDRPWDSEYFDIKISGEKIIHTKNK